MVGWPGLRQDCVSLSDGSDTFIQHSRYTFARSAAAQCFNAPPLQRCHDGSGPLVVVARACIVTGLLELRSSAGPATDRHTRSR